MLTPKVTELTRAGRTWVTVPARPAHTTAPALAR
jgi:hypothetical protein